MIKLQKADVPLWLQENREKKTKEYIAASADKKPSPWRAEEIVSTLKAESSKKCIYCEGKIDDVSYSAVEHIKPKHKFEELVLDWKNLGLVCTRCNVNKGKYWSENSEFQILDPYQDPISDHLMFRGPMTVAQLHSSRGAITVKKLKFSKREDLLVSRMRRIEELEVRLKLWHDAVDLEIREVFAEDIRDYISPEQEFSGVLSSFAIDSGFPVLDELQYR